MQPRPCRYSGEGGRDHRLGHLSKDGGKHICGSSRGAYEVNEYQQTDRGGGGGLKYGPTDAQQSRYWKAGYSKAPIVLFIHGGSWMVGTCLDSTGSAKVEYLVNKGNAFATVDYTLVPIVTVEQQVKEVADSIGFLVKKPIDIWLRC